MLNLRIVKRFYLGPLISSVFLVSCASPTKVDSENPVVQVSAAEDSIATQHFYAIQSFFIDNGYELREVVRPHAPSAWAKEQFNVRSTTNMSVRSKNQVPDWENTYYRFGLIIETFDSQTSAESRLERLFDKPPEEPNAEPPKAFPLRRGFVSGKKVYTLTTDVNGFFPELERLVTALERHLKH